MARVSHADHVARLDRPDLGRRVSFFCASLMVVTLGLMFVPGKIVAD